MPLKPRAENPIGSARKTLIGASKTMMKIEMRSPPGVDEHTKTLPAIPELKAKLRVF